MKAVVYTRYGPPEVLKIKDIEKPVPKDNEVLIKIFATSVTSADHRLRSFDVPTWLWLPIRIAFGIRGPRKKILGMDVAGEIEAVGKDVKIFKKGNKVFGSTYPASGGYAEYISMAEDSVLTIKPSKMTYEEAAAIFFGGHTALHFLKKANLKKGQKVLIYGASGSVGTYAVQLTKYFGAEVTGVCSTTNLELVKSLGADKVFDYTKGDFTGKYDIIFDTVGKSPFSHCVNSLTKNGLFLRVVHMEPIPIAKGLWTNMRTSKKVIGGEATEHKEDLVFLTKLFEEKKIKPVIDKIYPMEEIVEAHRYVDKGHKKGNVVITIRRN